MVFPLLLYKCWNSAISVSLKKKKKKSKWSKFSLSIERCEIRGQNEEEALDIWWHFITVYVSHMHWLKECYRHPHYLVLLTHLKTFINSHGLYRSQKIEMCLKTSWLKPSYSLRLGCGDMIGSQITGKEPLWLSAVVEAQALSEVYFHSDISG